MKLASNAIVPILGTIALITIVFISTKFVYYSSGQLDKEIEIRSTAETVYCTKVSPPNYDQFLWCFAASDKCQAVYAELYTSDAKIVPCEPLLFLQ